MIEKKWTRRTIALTLVGTFCGVCAYLAIQGNEMALTAVIAGGANAYGFYLLSKSLDKGNQ